MHGNAQGYFANLFLRITDPIVFGKRAWTLTAILGLTLLLSWQALHLRLEAGYEKQIPLDHPYMQVFKQYQNEFGGGNIVLFAVQSKRGDIYSPAFMETLRELTQSIFFTNGVDRARVSSLFTPDVRYIETVEGGFSGGNVIPADYAPTTEMMKLIRSNVARAKAIGRYVANDETGAMVFSELLEKDPTTGKPLDYLSTAQQLEQVRQRFLSRVVYEYKAKQDIGPFRAGETLAKRYTKDDGIFSSLQPLTVKIPSDPDASAITIPRDHVEVLKADNPDFNPDVDIHVVGFAKAMGDIADATVGVVAFFGLAVGLIWLVLWWYTGSPLIALLPLSCGLLAVIWELGLLHWLGFGLDPFAILVPFLVLAISVSHGIQITSFWLLEISRKDTSSFEASRNTYKRLVMPGITALITNVMGFATILLIPVVVVREMAVNAMLGLLAVIVCKKILLPCLLSFVKLRDPGRFADYQHRRDRFLSPIWILFSHLTRRPVAFIVLTVACMGWGMAQFSARHLKVGDLHQGIPELKPDSRFNRDSIVISDHYAIGIDQLKVIAEGRPDGCIDYSTMDQIDRFAYRMEGTTGVQSTLSLPQLGKLVYSAFNEGNPKYQVLPRSVDGLVLAGQQFPTSTGLLNKDCSAIPIVIFTTDHKADTIDHIIAAINTFTTSQEENSPVSFRLATGNVGVMAATNDVIKKTEKTVLFWVFLGIGVCIWMSFRSLSSLICILIPLWMVSVLTYAVMVALDIGLKVSTLPVSAFAAGIGVDYGIYIYSVLEECVRRGMPMQGAYAETLKQTGKAVIVTALTLAAAVLTWIFSGLQFQADMGILLTIMFLANAAAALLLLPAFASFVLKRDSASEYRSSEANA